MKISRKVIQPILFVLLIITSASLFLIKSEKDAMKKSVDQNFIEAISDSMGGLSKDYSKLSYDEKIKSYYQAVYGLKTAQDIFHISSYKEYDSVFQVLNGLYIYLLEYDHKNDDYEIGDNSYIYDTIWKIVAQPEDEKLITKFNTFIENKRSVINN